LYEKAETFPDPYDIGWLPFEIRMTEFARKNSPSPSISVSGVAVGVLEGSGAITPPCRLVNVGGTKNR
jgi:hypothetical protein